MTDEEASLGGMFINARNYSRITYRFFVGDLRMNVDRLEPVIIARLDLDVSPET